jgi:phage recombination protein Bet|tara:strand:+ start:1805 stop:2776 length:972 start_codon:yes stop_codon:yes gene_type:complete
MAKEVMKYENITPDQVDLIKSQIAVGATDDELKLFLHVADKSGLDPLSKQIYFIKRSGKMTIQTAIDGFRSIADRTGQYISSEEPVFEEIGNNPVKATVTVGKIVQGVEGKFTASARWSEYYPGKSQGFMWDKMPHTMLGKCAEALALRKAFPSQLSGLYTGDEMAQAGKDGIPNQSRNINPKGGSKQLEESLKEEPSVEAIADAIKPIVLDIPTPISAEDSDKILEFAQTKLDESFAFCKDKVIHDRIINNLNDIKYECTQENTEVLTNFAHTFPANQELFQNIARKYQQEWKEGMNHTNWNTLIKYMGELNNFFPVEEEAT